MRDNRARKRVKSEVNELKGILVEGIHHWGFSIRVPKTSAGGSSYPYVPISTILGALSRGYCTSYAVKDEISCTYEFVQFYKNYIFWVAYGVDEPRLIPYSDLMRQERVPYRKLNYRKPGQEKDWFGVSAFGKTYGEGVRFSIALIASERVEELSKLAWQVVALGSKESLVSIINVRNVDVVEDNASDTISTQFYIPAVCASGLDPSEFKEFELPVLNAYRLSETPAEGVFDSFWIPVRGPLIGGYGTLTRDKISEDCKVFRLEDKYLIAPREGLKRWLK